MVYFEPDYFSSAYFDVGVASEYFDCTYFDQTYFDSPGCGAAPDTTGHHPVRVLSRPPQEDPDELLALL